MDPAIRNAINNRGTVTSLDNAIATKESIDRVIKSLEVDGKLQIANQRLETLEKNMVTTKSESEVIEKLIKDVKIKYKRI